MKIVEKNSRRENSGRKFPGISRNFPKSPKSSFSGFSKKGVFWAVIVDFRCFWGVRKRKENTEKTRENFPSLFSRFSEFPNFFFLTDFFPLFFKFSLIFAL